MLRSHLFLQPLQKTAASHPQVGQGKERHQVSLVLGQSPVLDLGETELPLDDPKRVLHIGQGLVAS